MQSKQIVVKNYEYTLKNLLMIWFGVFVCLFFILWPFLLGKIICASLAIIFLLCAICLPHFSKNFDVITDEGIKRIKKGKVLFELPWSDIEGVSYLGLRGIIVLSQNVLSVYPKKDKGEILPSNLKNYDNKICISVQLNRRDLKYIDKNFIPPIVRRIK